MVDLFSSIPVRAEGVTGSFVQTQMQMRARDLFTGLFHIRGERQLVLLLLHGRLISLYELVGGRWELLPQILWDETIASSGGDLRELGLPDEGLRVYRLLLEADYGEARTMPSIRAYELTPYVSNWHRGGRAGLVFLHQPDVSAVMLLPARSPEPTEGVLVSRSQLRTGPAVVTQVRDWGDRLCQVTLCAQSERSEGWKEYNLRISFGGFMQRSLERYEELAGRFLVADLGEQVNMESHSRGWAISLFGHNLSVRQYFETAVGAGRAYATLLNVINQQMNSVVGNRMAESIFSSAVLQQTEDERNLVQSYVISAMLPNSSQSAARVSR
ncbi:MAG: hypothetical protein AB1649_15495 [Chloroflexota bacterium]